MRLWLISDVNSCVSIIYFPTVLLDIFKLIMELKFLISSHKLPPFYPSCYPLQKCKSFSNFYLSTTCVNLSKTPFLGQSLVLRGNNESSTKWRKYSPVIRSGLPRRKELPFDNVIERDKKLKFVLKIRKILMSQPDRIMALRGLGRFRRALGLQKKKRFVDLLKKFPAVFEIVEDGVYSLRFKLTHEAEKLYLEELKIRNGMEGLMVVKLRKLLMMSIDKRILLAKIAHLKTDLGLPPEFRDTICQRYPQYFKVVATGRGPALELTRWDAEIAVSAAELAEEDKVEERDLVIDRAPRFNRVRLPKGLCISKGGMRKLSAFRDMPFISPYSDFSDLRSSSLEKEKHACGVIHEILSLTLEKRTLVAHLTHFREEFGFPQRLRGMLIRHPDMFYVSLKGDTDSVFLREAYRDSVLIEKDEMMVIKEKLRALVNVRRFSKRNAPGTDSGEAEGTEQDDASDEDEDDDEDDWSDIDNVWSDDDVDDDDFDDDDKVVVPVFPDGTPREHW